MYERFTDRARKVMQLANQEAQRFNHEYIGTEHILLGLVKEGSGVAADVLKKLDIDLHKIRQEVEKLVTASLEVGTPGRLPQTPRAKKVIEYTLEEARNLSLDHVGTEHLLLGLLREQEGVAAQVLMNLGLRLEDVREEVLNLLGHNAELAESGETQQVRGKSKTPALDSFGVDLTELARQGKLVPVVGHTREIEEALAVLLCQARRGVLLVGEPGIGVADVVEGLAQLLVRGDVPTELKGRRLASLDLAMLTAVAQWKGDVSRERFRAVLAEARRERVLLFVRDLHHFLSADAADLSARLWTAVRDDRLLLIAAAPPDYVRARIEADALLREVFQTVTIHPPTPDEALGTLRNVRPRYESHHRVRITDGALTSAVALAERYLSGRYLTEVALQVVDRAGALLVLRNRPPPDLKEIDERVEQLNAQKESAVAEQDFEKAAGLRDQADKLKKKKEGLLREWSQGAAEGNGVVDEAVVREVVGELAGMSLPRPAADEAARLQSLEEDLLHDVIGQREAVAAVVRAVCKRRAGLSLPWVPVDSFLFVGPTGAGKTQLAESLAGRLFGNGALTRVDMVNFADAGSGEGLIEALRGRSNGVLVFDRIDRAHPTVRDRLLPLVAEGILTDHGRRLDFRDCVIVLTTTAGGEEQGGVRELVLADLRNILCPELLARLEVVFFRGLSRDDIRAVVVRQLAVASQRLAEKGLALLVTDEAREFLVAECPLPGGGFLQPLKRGLDRLLFDPLSEGLIRGHFKGKTTITVRIAWGRDGRCLVLDA